MDDSDLPGRFGRREGDGFVFTFEEREIRAWPGESVAGALMAAGVRTLRRSENGTSRGLLCGIGVCWECRCVIDDVPNRRACIVEARPGMTVRKQSGLAV